MISATTRRFDESGAYDEDILMMFDNEAKNFDRTMTRVVYLGAC